MTEPDRTSPSNHLAFDAIDIGRPVEWMIDPIRPDVILGVTYRFGTTGNEMTVWYTSNKRRPKQFTCVQDLKGA